MDIISKVQMSDWRSPLVIIPKTDGGLRLCADYKVGVNPQLASANYPIRRIDLYKAYLHVPVRQESSVIPTISTHMGYVQVNRLSFGVKTAHAEANRTIE